jgi:AraC-like DNA-binding protein
MRCGTHVRRVFSRDLGLPPKEWLRQERMVRARQAVVAGVPLAEVARQSGFARPAEFIREFRRTYGGSPGRGNRKSSIPHLPIARLFPAGPAKGERSA